MHTLFNSFPDLLNFSILAPVILRTVSGLIFLNLGSLKLGRERAGWIKSFEILGWRPEGFFVGLLGIIEIVAGLLLIVGAYAQISALVLAIIAIGETLIEYKEENILKRDFVFYLLLAVICLSIVLTGAGLFAFDIPNL